MLKKNRLIVGMVLNARMKIALLFILKQMMMKMMYHQSISRLIAFIILIAKIKIALLDILMKKMLLNVDMVLTVAIKITLANILILIVMKK